MGFTKGKATGGVISKLIMDLNLAQNKGHYSIAIFVDYCKALNCVRPDILLDK